MVHLDIKPSNVMLGPGRSVKILDLGIAQFICQGRSSGENHAEWSSAVGTPDYMAPEQIRFESSFDGRADIYALGATLFHMLAGRPPYGDAHTTGDLLAKHVRAPIPWWALNVKSLSPATLDLVRRMMAKGQEERYATAEGLVEAIREALRIPKNTPHRFRTRR
jgi:serine/threonine-protein kinase